METPRLFSSHWKDLLLALSDSASALTPFLTPDIKLWISTLHWVEKGRTDSILPCHKNPYVLSSWGDFQLWWTRHQVYHGDHYQVCRPLVLCTNAAVPGSQLCILTIPSASYTQTVTPIPSLCKVLETHHVFPLASRSLTSPEDSH